MHGHLSSDLAGSDSNLTWTQHPSIPFNSKSERIVTANVKRYGQSPIAEHDRVSDLGSADVASG